jgi:O-antigen biosynthesis protein
MQQNWDLDAQPKTEFPIMNAVQIIIPVHNALRESRRCLDSLWAHTNAPYALEIVDDQSDSHCASALKNWVREHESPQTPPLRYHRQDQNLGFVKSCNQAIMRSDAEFIVLLNSDVTCSSNWLSKLLTFIKSKPKAALVTPLSNNSSLHSFSIPPGWNAFQLDQSLSDSNRNAEEIDLVTASGFCMVLRSSLLPSPCFDEAFSPGYGEESDLSMRLREQGKLVLACPTVFLHHQGQASFTSFASLGATGQKDSFMSHPNFKVFMDRWREPYHQDLETYRQAAQIPRLRAHYPRSPRQTLATKIQLFRRIASQRGHFYTIKEGFKRVSSKLLASISSRGLHWTAREVQQSLFPAAASLPDSSQSSNHPLPQNLQVLFLLEEVGGSGGVKVVIEWLNGLIMRGFHCSVAVPADSPITREALDCALFEPFFYRSKKELADSIQTDCVVATLWSTAATARFMLDQGRAKQGVFYVQDQEERFYQESRVKNLVRASYQALPNIWTTSSWTAQYLEGLGRQSSILAPGVSLDDFYPRAGERLPGPVRVLAMARPEKSRRGFQKMTEAFSLLKNQGLDFELSLFGSEKARSTLPWAKVYGFIRGARLRDLYQNADVFLDTSSYQAFGLPNLEAMACQTAVIGPEIGGFADYAIHNKNALLVNTESAGAIAGALESLIKDLPRALALGDEALNTAKALSFNAFLDKSIENFETLMDLSTHNKPYPWAFRASTRTP